MVYNRYGYALLGLILVDGLVWVLGRGRERDSWAGGFSTGAALALTLFLKASFFFVGGAMVAVLFAFRPFGWRRTGGAALGFCIVSFCLLAYLKFDAAAMLRDLRMAAGAHSAIISAAGLVWHTLDLAAALLQIVLFTFIASLSLETQGRLWPRLRLVLLGAILFAFDVAVLSANSQNAGLPLLALTAILIVNEMVMRRQALPGASERSCRLYYAAAFALGAVLFVPQFASDVAGLGYGALRKIKPAAPATVVPFTSPVLRPLMLYDGHSDPESNGRVFTAYVNDGVALLHWAAQPGEKVLTMDMTNPFPYALGWAPMRGGIAAVTYNNTLNEKYHPRADEYFGDADIVMAPKRPAHDLGMWTAFYRIYEKDLRRRFGVAAETEWWWMWRRR